MHLSNLLLIYFDFYKGTKTETKTTNYKLSYLDSVPRPRLSNIITKANASLDWRVESRIPGLDKINVASVIRN